MGKMLSNMWDYGTERFGWGPHSRIGPWAPQANQHLVKKLAHMNKKADKRAARTAPMTPLTSTNSSDLLTGIKGY